MASASANTTVAVAGRQLSLSNLSKILYPETGTTKGEVIDYYSRVAPVLLPHLAGRPLSLKRYPDGVAGQGFFAKNVPNGAPDWVRTERLPAPGSTKNRDEIDYLVLPEDEGDALATLVWMANLAALELHVPQWQVGPRGGVRGTDLLVFDLDPGAPATVVECSAVALRLREVLDADGLHAVAKTSGSKGMQVYAAIKPVDPGRTSDYAKAVAQQLEKEDPQNVTSVMRRALRPGKVFIDWSQNNTAKTTVAPYSLRARPAPTVSTPLYWDEVAACRRPEELVFPFDAVLARAADDGDLFAELLTDDRPALPRR
ncbi:non-homologous end-joining DNA ligase [Cryptosporangium aurantiacum]|uniref:Bifunctional non-homologous end joining protein LigD n=1 Tax=Cryptosporangium aurantiacum TaxID=134849 RepID=A0A1M7JEJ8_9ACTN|nr:non-homologous end-joining DNA ligase [Cryptosporangium aurantiacum]SHM51414.1 bifunctional non-homologous end joining protein LigD [Cryptosporangium aurantiacum]